VNGTLLSGRRVAPLFDTLLACANDPGIGLQFLIEELSLHAPALAFAERLANPPDFSDAGVEERSRRWSYIIKTSLFIQ